MTFDQKVEIEGVSVEWDCRFDDVSGAFLGWFPRPGSPLGEGFSLAYSRVGPSGQAGNGWYLHHPDGIRDFVDPQPPPFAATLEAATRRALAIRQREPDDVAHVLTVSYTVDDDGCHVTCSCGAFNESVGFDPSIDDLNRIQWEHRSRSTT